MRKWKLMAKIEHWVKNNSADSLFMEIVSRIWHETLSDQLIDNLINDDRAIQCCVAPSELSEIFKSSSNCSSRHPRGGSGSTIKTRLNISFDPAPALQTPEFSQIDLGRVSQSGHGPVKSLIPSSLFQLHQTNLSHYAAQSWLNQGLFRSRLILILIPSRVE